MLSEFEIDAWRLQRGGRPLDVKSYPKGKYRFDAPGEEYPAPLYANTMRLGCFAEVFGDAGVIEAAEIRRRSLFRLRSTRALRLLRLENGGRRRRSGWTPGFATPRCMPGVRRGVSPSTSGIRMRTVYGTYRATLRRGSACASSWTDA